MYPKVSNEQQMDKTAKNAYGVVLDALQRVKCQQQDMRAALLAGDRKFDSILLMLTWFGQYVEELPRDILWRLDKISLQEVQRSVATAACSNVDIEALLSLISQIAGNDAFAQVIRAANVYREKLGYPLLRPDGWPEWTDIQQKQPEEEQKL